MSHIQFDAFVETGRAMIQDGIVIAPWLTRGKGKHRISPALLQDIEDLSIKFSATYWSPDLRLELLGAKFPISSDLVVEAYYETIASTAVNLSLLELGTLTVTKEMINVAERLTEKFIEQVGPEQFLRFYLASAPSGNLDLLLLS
ncbi:MAG: hypothetical protein K6T83_17915 [Alicyclobacillus sp.]|nr:hypothetical protein [Alicyclobacillus sp.]